MKKWQAKSSKLIFKTKYFKIRNDIIKLPTGKLKEWTYWDSSDSVMVLGTTKDKKLVMIKQYRYLVGAEVIEFPSGSLHGKEDIKTGAKREFEEETGYRCQSLVLLGSFYETYGQLNRQIHLFFAKNVSVKLSQDLDKGRRGFEDIKVKLVNFNKALNLALNNKIVALGSSLAILLLKEKIDSKELSF